LFTKTYLVKYRVHCLQHTGCILFEIDEMFIEGDVMSILKTLQ